MAVNATPSLAGAGNVQFQNLVVIASGTDTNNVNLGTPPSNGTPTVTIVVPVGGATNTITLLSGVLGISKSGTNIVSGVVSISGSTGYVQATYAGGYWLLP